MQQDRHEVVLEANITNFKNKMKEAQNISKEVGKKISDNTKFNVWQNGVMTLSNGTQLVKKSQEELNQKIEDTGEVSQRAGTEISTAFNKGLKSVKKLTLGFLGARSAFGLFRKYMSEYSSENEVFAQKMQLTTSVIANVLAPAFEFFGNVIQYVVIGLARVIELLFGVNILGKTVDNSLKGASKSAKELNENLSGLDEISNIDQSAGGLSTGIGGQLEALDEFQKKIVEVEAWFKKYKIDEKILAIKNAIKAVWDWASDHPILTTAFVAGLLSLKTNILPSLISMISGSGNTSLIGGFKALLAISLSVWVIDQINQLDKLENKVNKITSKLKKQSSKEETKGSQTTAFMKEFNDYNEQDYKNAKKNFENAIKDLEDAKKQQEKLVTAWTWILEPAKYYNAKDEIKKLDKRIDQIKEKQKKLNVTYEIGTNQVGKTVNLTDTMQKNLEKANNKAKFVNDNTFEWQGNIQNANNKADKLIGTLSTGFNNLDYSIKNSSNNFENFTNDINATFDKNYELNIQTDDKEINNTKQKIDNTFNKTYKLKLDLSMSVNTINKAVNTAKQAFKEMGFQVPSYDVGTDYVPRDQIAMVHEGERIIPKKYNNSQYMGNAETNSLLMELNRNVLELANKPTTLNVNGKELAKATYSDFQEENSRRGNNMSVRRI